MSKFIIYIAGHPLVNGHTRYEFKWDEALKCYVYRGQAFSESEFNTMADLVFKNLNYLKLFPNIKCLEAAPAAVAETPVALPPISTIAAGEVTLEQAVEVIERLAPERLKKKPGPRQPDLLKTG